MVNTVKYLFANDIVYLLRGMSYLLFYLAKKVKKKMRKYRDISFCIVDNLKLRIVWMEDNARKLGVLI